MLSKLQTQLVLLALVTGALFLVAACAKKAASTVTQSSASSSPTPRHFLSTDLAKLRWIEGTWRGTSDALPQFYESYQFDNPSTLVVMTLDNDNVYNGIDRTQFVLKNGQFSNEGEGSRWIATEMDNDSVTFYPLAKVEYSFRWKRESENLWFATLNWPATDSRSAFQRVYRMERWRK